MAVPSIEFLSRYLEREGSDEDVHFPWNKLTCLAVVCYAVKKNLASSSRKTIRSLDDTAEQYLNAENKCKQSTHRKEEDVIVMKNTLRRFSKLFVNSFIPEAQIHFTIPERDHLSDKDKNLQRIEILAGFLDFLVQILHREANVDTARKQQYAPLQKALLFLLAVLGDKPFDCSTLHSVLEEQVKDLLVESEALANEAGRLIYSCVFSKRLVKKKTFYARRNSLLKKFEILNANIKLYSIKFSELSINAVPRSNVVDSFFIIHSLVDDLDNLSPQEFFSMKDQIAMLHDELRTSEALLKFIKARQDDGAMKESIGQIRDLAYEAEYLINSHVVGNIPAWYLDLRLPSITQNIKLAREKLHHSKEMQPSQVMVHYGGEISDITYVAAVDDNHFVELQFNIRGRILADLVGKQKSPRQTISINGMPGLGKTTIANKLYACSSAFHYFDRRVWCVVSQTYTVRSLLINILQHLARELKKDEILRKSDAELGVDIHKSLKQRRYLIVLDDVWHLNAWYGLERYLPDDRNGSRVILTSRIKDAAPDGSIYHTLPLFSTDQCWDLLEKKMFPGEVCPPELLSIGKGIAAKCSGIPLAVIVTAGILANVKREKDSWERVEKQLDAFLLDGRDYRKILEISYEHLPHNMKPCFLYFAAFPEDAEISVYKLAWRWIAEGFIQKDEGTSREQIAEMYLLELMNRSLVIPGKRGSDGRTKTCRIHDLLRDICVMKANEENFLNSKNELSLYEKHQRSYLPFMSTTDSRPFGLHCRSLIGGLPDRSSCFQTRALLKVLDIRPNKFRKLDAASFNLPIQLKYLGTNHLTNIMIAKLDNLEFINVVNSSQIKVPSIILRMKKLRHLIVKKEALFEDDGCSSRTTNIRTLLYVCIYKGSDEAILRDSPHLQKLKCKVGGETIFPDLSFLEELELLKMVFEVYCRNRGENVSNLKFPSTIKNLCLSNAKLPWKKMSVIGRLPNLCVLKLDNHAFVGDEWETLDGEFEELRYLRISYSDLEHWTSCSEHFPRLEQLVLAGFRKLVEIPCDLGNISTLQRIDVSCCLIRASLSAVQIEQEQRGYGNEELQVNILTTYWTKEELVALYRENMENVENGLVVESDGDHMYALSSIICTSERNFLVRSDGEQINVNSLKGKIVGIYFSAFWDESCQLFSSKLMKVYNELKKYGHLEIVFVSGDEDINDESFNADLSKFPWLAIPSTESDTRNKLDELFNVERIPHLVILDENGKVLTEEGVRIVEDGGLCFVPESHPNFEHLEEKQDEAKWNDYVESLLISKTRDYVIDNDKTKIPVSSLVGKTTMLFFAAHQCQLSRKFAPKLVQAYQEINEKYSNSLEVIFMSYDDDILSFEEFFSTMPWFAFPFLDNRKESLRRLHKVKHTPMVIILGPTGKTVTTEGWELILCHGAEAYPFTPERVKELKSKNDKMAELWPKKVRKEVHEHELGLYKHVSYYYYCDCCDEMKCNWVYWCADCNLDFHPKCALGDEYNAESWPKEVHELKEPGAEAERNYSPESLLVSESLDYVIDLVGTKIPVSNLVGKTTMLFFAARWCPPCRFVLAELVQKYQETNEKNNNSVEVIFISSDEDQSSFDDFFAMMPWLALPFHDNRIKSLSRLFNVKTIPMLVTIEPTGKSITGKPWELINYPGAETYPFTCEWVESQTKAQRMVILWPKKVTNKLHEHELCLLKQIIYDCDGCQEVGFDWSYKCEACVFILHPNCALREDKAKGKEELEGGEENWMW